MTTRPRISAPIARVRIKTFERKRDPTGTGRWRPTDPPLEAELGDEQSASEGSHPPFYPFAWDRPDEGDR